MIYFDYPVFKHDSKACGFSQRLLMDPTILQSLQEIASLLLLIHDFYLKETFGSDILVSLMTLIVDVNLQDLVSVIDAERLRGCVMKFGETQMDYELFYEWLRGIGQLVYPADDVGGKKALHFLLTQHIMPFAVNIQNDFETYGQVHTKYLPFYTEAALKTMIHNSEFLYLWFLHILQQQVWPHCK